MCERNTILLVGLVEKSANIVFEPRDLAFEVNTFSHLAGLCPENASYVQTAMQITAYILAKLSVFIIDKCRHEQVDVSAPMDGQTPGAHRHFSRADLFCLVKNNAAQACPVMKNNIASVT